MCRKCHTTFLISEASTEEEDYDKDFYDESIDDDTSASDEISRTDTFLAQIRKDVWDDDNINDSLEFEVDDNLKFAKEAAKRLEEQKLSYQELQVKVDASESNATPSQLFEKLHAEKQAKDAFERTEFEKTETKRRDSGYTKSTYIPTYKKTENLKGIKKTSSGLVILLIAFWILLTVICQACN